MISFDTYQDALDAGYTTGRCTTRACADYRGRSLMSIDTSGGNSFGYDSALIIGARDGVSPCGNDSFEFDYLAHAESVWFADGKGGRMYPPGTLEAAMRTLIERVDAHLAEHPEDRPDDERVAEAKAFGPLADTDAFVHPLAEVHPEARIGIGARVCERAVVGCQAYIGHGAVIDGEVFIGEGADIGADVEIMYPAYIGSGVHIPCRTEVVGGARIERMTDVTTFGPVGPHAHTAMMYRMKDGRAIVKVGCWQGSVEDLETGCSDEPGASTLYEKHEFDIGEDYRHLATLFRRHLARHDWSADREPAK